jgi:hypothetical protein
LCRSDDVEVTSSSQHHAGHACRPHPRAPCSLQVATATIPRECMALQAGTHICVLQHTCNLSAGKTAVEHGCLSCLGIVLRMNHLQSSTCSTPLHSHSPVTAVQW